jgi:YD repeat-containing protein
VPRQQRIFGLSAGGTAQQVVQYSYDASGRVECTALRMNPAVFGSLPASACNQGTAGSGAKDFGPDRITKNTYDAVGRVTKVQAGVGTADQADEVTSAYTSNGQTAYVTDAESNRTAYSYDGYGRLARTEYPSPTKGANASNASDYEQLGYDANSNVTSRRLRDGLSIAYAYDKLDRLVTKDLPGSESDASYTYDSLGLTLTATQNAQTLGFSRDALGRTLSQSGPLGTLTYAYDAVGRRTSVTYPATGDATALTVNYDYDITGNVTKIRENGAVSGCRRPQ